MQIKEYTRNPTHSLFRSLQRQLQHVNVIVLFKIWYWKGCFSVTLRKTLHVHCSDLPGDRVFEEIALLRRWSQKAIYWWHRGSLCTFIVQVPLETELWWIDIMVLLKRLCWKGHLPATLGKSLLCMFIVQFSQKAEFWVYRIVLLGRWSWKVCSSVTLGKILLYTFTVQVSLETEPLSR